MRISFITEKLNMNAGGSNVSLDLVARLLSNRGHNVKVIVLDPNAINLPQDPPFEIIRSKSRRGNRIGLLKHAYHTMSNNADDTDLFHMYSPFYLAPAGLFRRMNRSIPVIGRLNTYSMFCVNMSRMDGGCHKHCSVRSKFAHQDSTLIKRLAKLPLYASRTYLEPKLGSELDNYFAISPAVKRIYDDVGFPGDKIDVIPNFLDPRFGPGGDDLSPPQRHDTLKLLYVGRIEPLKGLDCLIRALSNTKEMELTVVGDGVNIEENKSLVSNFGLDNRVEFEGWVPYKQLPNYYREADLFVHPGRWPDPCPRTVLESLQWGTPAVVSDFGGPPWVVGDAGITFPPDDVESLARILSNLQNDRKRLHELRRACSDRTEFFDSTRIVSTIENKYSRAIENY